MNYSIGHKLAENYTALVSRTQGHDHRRKGGMSLFRDIL